MTQTQLPPNQTGASAGPAAAQELLERGRAAYARYAWAEAAAAFREADQQKQLPVDELQLLGEAEWWLGNMDASIDARERAYQRLIEAGNRRRAARVALALAANYSAKLSSSRAQGWHRRAVRLLRDEPECAEHGYAALEEVWPRYRREAPDTARALAERAVELGTSSGDHDLEMMARAELGRVLVHTGEIEEGMALEEEASVAAVGGELTPYATAVVFCSVISTSRELTDFARAGEWADAAKRWCERQSITGFPGVCRVYRSEVMRLRGAWSDAEAEIRRACGELRPFAPKIAGAAFSELGMIRLRVGDLDGAAEAFAQATQLSSSAQPGLALLLIAQGRPRLAQQQLLEALERDDLSQLDRIPLLSALVEAATEAGDLDEAARAESELGAAASAYDTPVVKAAAAANSGRLALAKGEHEAAAKALRRAVQLYDSADLPYEAAMAHVLLGKAYRAGGDEERAAFEIGVAKQAFDRLGAARDSRIAAEQLPADGAYQPLKYIEQAPLGVTRTFMFTDIVGSTPLVEAIGDAAWHSLVAWHDETLRALFAKHGGEEIDHSGDGFFVAFNDSSPAIDCAIAIQRTLARHRREHGFAPELRIGIHAAESVGARRSYWGKGVHEAARIGAAAGGGEIVASAATTENGSSGYSVSAPRVVMLKGIAEPVSLVTINWKAS